MANEGSISREFGCPRCTDLAASEIYRLVEIDGQVLKSMHAGPQEDEVLRRHTFDRFSQTGWEKMRVGVGVGTQRRVVGKIRVDVLTCLRIHHTWCLNLDLM